MTVSDEQSLLSRVRRSDRRLFATSLHSIATRFTFETQDALRGYRNRIGCHVFPSAEHARISGGFSSGEHRNPGLIVAQQLEYVTAVTTVIDRKRAVGAF
jgi:hypothetical protein